MKVLAIVAHMDDAEIHCGGTLRKYVLQGDDVYVLVVSNGNKGTFTLEPEELTEIRRNEQREASKRLGVNEPFFFNYEDNMMIGSIDLQMELLAMMRKVEPDVIITHTPQDGSNDHSVTGASVVKALIGLPFKNMPCEEPPIHKMPQVFFMEPAGGIGFLPEHYVDISDVEDDKIYAFEAHESQIAYDERYRADIEILGRFRGYQAGCQYAETFQAYRFFGFMPDFKLLP